MTQVTFIGHTLFHTLIERRLSMGTNIRTTLSKKSPYYISKHRRLELVHFCLQYPEWKGYLSSIKCRGSQDEFSDPTGEEAVRRVLYSRNVETIEVAARIAGADIYEYLLLSVTEDVSFPTLKTKYDIPCGADLFYNRYHKFWFILSQKEHMFL